MAKIKLGQRPTTFQRNVKFQLVDGSEGSIGMVYKYRTRKEFGALQDEMLEQMRAETSARDPGAQVSIEQAWKQAAENSADFLLKLAEGWDLDEPFTREAIEQLSDEIPAAVTAIIDSYRISITEGRLGN